MTSTSYKSQGTYEELATLCPSVLLYVVVPVRLNLSLLLC